MRSQFLGTGEPGYHPLRKLRTVGLRLRFAALHDFSVACKIVFSALLAFAQWIVRCAKPSALLAARPSALPQVLIAA